jgi:hypothetical protein
MDSSKPSRTQTLFVQKCLYQYYFSKQLEEVKESRFFAKLYSTITGADQGTKVIIKSTESPFDSFYLSAQEAWESLLITHTPPLHRDTVIPFLTAHFAQSSHPEKSKILRICISK